MAFVGAFDAQWERYAFAIPYTTRPARKIGPLCNRMFADRKEANCDAFTDKTTCTTQSDMLDMR